LVIITHIITIIIVAYIHVAHCIPFVSQCFSSITNRHRMALLPSANLYMDLHPHVFDISHMRYQRNRQQSIASSKRNIFATTSTATSNRNNNSSNTNATTIITDAYVLAKQVSYQRAMSLYWPTVRVITFVSQHAPRVHAPSGWPPNWSLTQSVAWMLQPCTQLNTSTDNDTSADTRRSASSFVPARERARDAYIKSISSSSTSTSISNSSSLQRPYASNNTNKKDIGHDIAMRRDRTTIDCRTMKIEVMPQSEIGIPLSSSSSPDPSSLSSASPAASSPSFVSLPQLTWLSFEGCWMSYIELHQLLHTARVPSLRHIIIPYLDWSDECHIALSYFACTPSNTSNSNSNSDGTTTTTVNGISCNSLLSADRTCDRCRRPSLILHTCADPTSTCTCNDSNGNGNGNGNGWCSQCMIATNHSWCINSVHHTSVVHCSMTHSLPLLRPCLTCITNIISPTEPNAIAYHY
jgi:hypothetical protein